MGEGKGGGELILVPPPLHPLPPGEGKYFEVIFYLMEEQWRSKRFVCWVRV